MSSYLVSNKTIGKIVRFIQDEIGDQPELVWHFGNNIDIAISRIFADCAVEEEELAAIGKALYDMNIRALSARYGAKAAQSDAKRSPYSYVACAPQSRTYSYVTLACYLYQCSEGDVPDELLYQALRTMQTRLAHTIVQNSAEFAQAPWE